MGEALILKSGSKLDEGELSATPKYVKAGKIFYGSGSDDAQIGEMLVVPKISMTLGINEIYSFQEGLHEGQDTFTQNIPTQAGPVIEPSAGGQTISVTGKYLTSNTTIRDIENLKPEVIKYGITIADITGTFQGFVD